MARQPKKEQGAEDDRPAIWKAYGRILKLLREKAGLTQAQLAERVGYSVEQVSSIEQARRPAKLAFTQAAERVLGAGGVLIAMQEDVDLARLPVFFQDAAQIETDAISFFWHNGLVVPGLLQTEGYARALLAAHCPPLGGEELGHLLEARVERQALLTRQPPVQLAFVIGEPALRTPVGGVACLKAQLRHLLKQGELPNVDIQVMPMSYGAHIGLNGPMLLMETAAHRQFAYIESQGQGMLISDPGRVSVLALRYGKLRSQALNTVESAKLIAQIEGEL